MRSGVAFVFESALAPVKVGRVDQIDEHLAGPMGDVKRHRMVVEGDRLSRTVGGSHRATMARRCTETA